MTQDVFKTGLYRLADEAEGATAPSTTEDCHRLYEEFRTALFALYNDPAPYRLMEHILTDLESTFSGALQGKKRLRN